MFFLGMQGENTSLFLWVKVTKNEGAGEYFSYRLLTSC